MFLLKLNLKMSDERTVWCGNLSDEVTEELLFELFLQVGPLERVKIPTDKEGRQLNYGFVTFKHEVSLDYAMQLLNGTTLFDRNLNIKYRNRNQNDSVGPRNDIRMPNQIPKPFDIHPIMPHFSPDLRYKQSNRHGHREMGGRYHDRHLPYERGNHSEHRNDSSLRHHGDLRNRVNSRRSRYY